MTDPALTDVAFPDEYLPDVTARWLGRVTQIKGDELAVVVRPRDDPTAPLEERVFDSRLLWNRRALRVGTQVAVDEFADGSAVAHRIGRWYQGPLDQLTEAVMWFVMAVVEIFR